MYNFNKNNVKNVSFEDINEKIMYNVENHTP